MDALLGAAALGDIGQHFPDTDPAYKGISSLKLLEHVTALLAKEGYGITNIDATIIAQKPKMAAYSGNARKHGTVHGHRGASAEHQGDYRRRPWIYRKGRRDRCPGSVPASQDDRNKGVMGMKIFNTLSRRKEEFIPLEKGKVKMYVCGPTVYNLIHIGNARPMIVFDTVRRYMEYKGYEVNFVSNFTDVDDKIIKKAIEEGVSRRRNFPALHQGVQTGYGCHEREPGYDTSSGNTGN